MNNIIYAKSAAVNILDELNIENQVHSIFENGMNIRGKNGLIFIGTDKNGELPFGIHLSQRDIGNLIDIDKRSIFKFKREEKILIVEDKLIDLNRVYYYNTKLSDDKLSIKRRALDLLLEGILRENFDTGLDIPIMDILSRDNSLIEELRMIMNSKDNKYIGEHLRRIIGRGRGLTPSGDDLLIGILWVNDIQRILSEEFLSNLKELILKENLTTDVSISYYKSAFRGNYSSNLIGLCDALVKSNKSHIEKYILKILEYGNTSGGDTLAGIALGIHMIVKK